MKDGVCIGQSSCTCVARQLISSSSRPVNTARGPVINEEDLVKALDSGKVLRAALDVFGAHPISPRQSLS